MDERRLREILERFDGIEILVVGDFFLDKYLDLDRRLSEVSLETGLEAYQVVDVRCSPGAAGTVTSNLRALDVGVTALGVIGEDGEGYELKRGLTQRDVDIAPLIEHSDLFTPTYTKPMMREEDGRTHELNRLDIKNREPLPAPVEADIIARLRAYVPRMDGVVLIDQVEERNCGVITDQVRQEIARLARRHPQVVFIADSRARIGLFDEVIIVPNAREATLALNREHQGDVDLAMGWKSGAVLFDRNGKPVFVTVGDQGVLVFTEGGAERVPAVEVQGEIDIVGAGDSVMAGIVTSLCSEADPREAALVGNLVASITIQQIGTTGTASRQEVLGRYRASLRCVSN